MTDQNNTSPGKDQETKKRRFSAFISNNYNHNAQNKRPTPTPIKVLMVGRPQVGKSSIVSMLINRDVIPGVNQGGIYIQDSTPDTSPSSPTPAPPTPSFPSSHSSSSFTPTPSSASITPSSSNYSLSSYTLSSTPSSYFTPPSPRDGASSSFNAPDSLTPSASTSSFTSSSSFISSSSTYISSSFITASGLTSSFNSETPTSGCSPSAHPQVPLLSFSNSNTNFNTPDISNKLPSPRQRSYTSADINPIHRPTIYHSEKYTITELGGFQEGSTDVIGGILEIRKWMEESQLAYNIVLMVLKAQDLSETDRRIFALCNALLHDMRDMIHLIVTGCDANPHWIQENELELKRVYGTGKAVGVAFPTTSSGLLACIFEEMRKESLIVLEDYICKNLIPVARVPTKTAMRGGSAGSNNVKIKPSRHKSRSFSK